jgi:hypothetical protein
MSLNRRRPCFCEHSMSKFHSRWANSSRDSSVSSRQSVPTPSSNSWATVTTIDSSYRPDIDVEKMSNVSSLQTSSPVYSGQKVEATRHSDANKLAGGSVSEPTFQIPRISASLLRVFQAPQSPSPSPQIRSQPPPMTMPWPRYALPKSPPTVRLGQSNAQSVQRNPPTIPRSQVLIERPKSVEAANCAQCLTPFSSTNLKYQCPNCSKFFDDQCSSKMVNIRWLSLLPVRVDDGCFIKLSGEKLVGKSLESSQP